MTLLRVLLLADTHIGFDEPRRETTRETRPRRGSNFLANFNAALEPALAGEVDLVVHGGDLLYRSKVPASLVVRAMAPLKAVADRGVPVVLAPGNHERSAIPYPLLALHPRIHLLTSPRTVRLDTAAGVVAVSGFAFRPAIRDAFPALLAATRWREHADAATRLLVLHQTVEGATVGPGNHVFRHDAETIRGRDLPDGVAAVLAGHIHRHQLLVADLAGRPLAAPVIYPGSIERTSRAEASETKGYVRLEFRGNALADWRFVPLPTRPLLDVALDPLAPT